MTTDPSRPDEAQPPRPGPMPMSAAVGAFRQALRDMVVLLVVLTVLGVGIGALTAGWKGVWGALIGVALAALFSGTTVLSVLRTADADAARMVAVVMGAWVAKIAVVFVVLAVLSPHDFYDRIVLGIVLLAGVLGSAVADLRAVQRARIPYIEPPQTPHSV